MSSLDVIADIIQKKEKFIICGHIMPDGDSLGSVLALGAVLKEMGKEVITVSCDPVPENLIFLPGIEDLIIGDKEIAADIDTAILLDCSVPDRLGSYGKILEWENVTKINIDHHPGNSVQGDYNYVDPLAAATGEILFDIIFKWEKTFSKQVATCIYTAMITDTGSFQYENTTPATLRRVAFLYECGISPSELNVKIFDEKPLPSLLLLRNVLQTLTLSECGRVAWMSVFKKDVEEVNASGEHTEQLINYPRSIKGIEVAILFRELNPGEFKVSFRSKGIVNVNKLAIEFGGGGHNKASGCIMKGDYPEITEKIIKAAVRYF